MLLELLVRRAQRDLKVHPGRMEPRDPKAPRETKEIQDNLALQDNQVLQAQAHRPAMVKRATLATKSARTELNALVSVSTPNYFIVYTCVVYRC